MSNIRIVHPPESDTSGVEGDRCSQYSVYLGDDSETQIEVTLATVRGGYRHASARVFPTTQTIVELGVERSSSGRREVTIEFWDGHRTHTVSGADIGTMVTGWVKYRG